MTSLLSTQTSIQTLSRLLLDGAPLEIHLIGVAGSGMSGLAALLLALGHRVSGSDRVTTEEVDRLSRQGLSFIIGHRAEDAANADLIVYSSAIHQGNQTLDEAKRLNKPLARRAEVLAALMLGKKGIIICGMHGKTTTSSMAAHLLGEAGLQPSHYVGAEIPILGTNARWSKAGDYFVAEGDESDGTLVHYSPQHAIVLNIELEHLDFYKNLEAIDAVYQRLIDQTKGSLFYWADDLGAARVCAQHPRAIAVGTGEECDYRYTKLKQEKYHSTFEVIAKNKNLGRLELAIPGVHNVSNAMLVIALALELGISFEVIAAALKIFCGAKRRFELKYENLHLCSTAPAKSFVVPVLAPSSTSCTLSCSAPSTPASSSAAASLNTGFRGSGLRIFDDYGHHPTEIAATLSTAHGILHGNDDISPGRLLVMFQPHRYSRTQAFQKEFGRALLAADVVFVTDIYPASEAPLSGVTGELIVTAAREQGHGAAFYEPCLEKLRVKLGAIMKPGDIILSLGAGNIHEETARLVEDLKKRDHLTSVMGAGSIQLYEPLSRHTTMRVGGPAQFWAEPETEEGFAKLVKTCFHEQIPLMVMGRGSNLIVRDGGVPGVVVHLVRGCFAHCRVEGTLITAGVGVKMKQLSGAARQAGLSGFEWMEGIPGNLGGSLRMNAGAMGKQTFDQVVTLRYVDQEGTITSCTPQELEVRYRDVPFLKTHYVLAATLQGHPGVPEQIDQLIQSSWTHRRETQPIAASAGCIFKNPNPNLSAGRLIEELGLKNHTIGKARVSEIHGNFIVNDGGATASEVLELIEKIKSVALEKRGIVLETEAQIVGVEV